MRREFVPFDEETIRKEFQTLPDADRAKLAALIEHYEAAGRGNPAPAQIDTYGDGLYRLRHVKPAYQGRMIFFASEKEAGLERLVVLVVYKKQGRKTPVDVLETAKRRKKHWEETRGKQ